MFRRFPLCRLLLVVGVLLLVLAACGGDDTSETDTVDTPAETAVDTAEETPTEVPTEVPTEAPSEVPTEVPTEVPVVELSGDTIRGGLLYDNWWTPLGLDTPQSDHPLWATQDTNTRSGKDTWRCKECHGWDYQGADGAYGGGSHFTGFKGIFQWAGAAAGEILDTLMGATNADHDFSTVMDEQALTDIALFISGEMLDATLVIDADKMAIGGDLALGQELFQNSCAQCHGPEGLAIDFKANVAGPEYLGGLAGGNPWEFLHKVRFGQPGVPEMTVALDMGWTTEEQLAVLAYAQSVPTENLITQGGLLYDKWWNALGGEAPQEDHPLWATQDTNERSGPDTWRCKECHGWDYQGADGAYGGGSHFTGFTGVFGASSMSAGDLVAWLDGTINADHDFSPYLDEAAINMLVFFVQNGVVDMSQYINDDKTVNGELANGKGLYNQGCARCHGDDGQTLLDLGELANDNPWETLHKTANGQPGENMPSGINLGWSWQELADVVAYLQSLFE